MYIPAAFREESIEANHALIRQYSFATLITCQDGSPMVSHLPFLLDAGRGPQGTLQAHMARANPHWQLLQETAEVLVIFQGPHGYISPSWYEAQPSVPTWNYAVTHVYGTPCLLDEEALQTLVEAMIVHYESSRDTPWVFDAPDEYKQKMRKAIVGFEIEIHRLEGKSKLGQNRSETDQSRMIEGLRESAYSSDRELADWMLAQKKSK